MRQAPPLDYSYARLRELDHLEDMGLEPRTDRVRRAPQRSKKSGLYITRSLWLSNNLLKSVRGLQALTRRLLWQPEALAWLNLSHNFLVELGTELADFHNLTILYLHCNRVHTLSGIAVLRHLPLIAHLTLHGNPLAQVPFYRGRVLSLVPQLRSLDGSCVLPGEREMPLPVFAPPFLVAEQPPTPPAREVELQEADTSSWLDLLCAEIQLRRQQRADRIRAMLEAEQASDEFGF
ncbi:leucine-rich repeat-containing protein 51-like [Schistocerca gregaria]|uniref:leucine-rich repeat-containing protein 51-like n=1 Tax=Schistocerca gregaria TaxID=7010 RepID=UPI00211F12A4|nr:leucine-rich repeat-containing protein 51-like [Schistocerca gregaria]